MMITNVVNVLGTARSNSITRTLPEQDSPIYTTQNRTLTVTLTVTLTLALTLTAALTIPLVGTVCPFRLSNRMPNEAVSRMHMSSGV